MLSCITGASVALVWLGTEASGSDDGTCKMHRAKLADILASGESPGAEDN